MREMYASPRPPPYKRPKRTRTGSSDPRVDTIMTQPTAEAHRKFLRLIHNEVEILPFDLSSAPQIFPDGLRKSLMPKNTNPRTPTVFSLRLLSTARRALPAARSLSSKGPLTNLTVDDDGIATLTMQRLPVNSLNLDLLQELGKALDEVEKEEAKGLIITSASPTVFSAGLDITEMYEPKMDRLSAFWTALQEFWIKLYGAPYPTAAAINGHAPAGGCLIAMSCEYRAMVNGKFGIGLNETALGIVAPRWFMDSMCNVLPQREAELALTTGRLFKVEEAHKVGLIDDIATNKEDALEKCKEFIERFDEISPAARGLTKQRLRQAPIQNLLKTREADLEEFKQLSLLPQVQQALGMYIQMLKQKRDKCDNK